MYTHNGEPQLLQYGNRPVDNSGLPRVIADNYPHYDQYGNANESAYLQRYPIKRSGAEPDATKIRTKRTPRIRKRHSPPGETLISTPLSELTKNMQVPIRDMEAWVNRSTEERMREVELKNGKIARPMNSFMLYRSAYAERTKEWCAQNNHQIVSQVSGQSWPLEPKEVKDFFEMLANTERNNHQQAHPNYKFAPNKNQNTPKKRRSQDDGNNASLKDPEYDIGSYSNGMNKRARSAIKEEVQSRHSSPLEQDSSYESRQATPFDQNGDLYANGDMNRSSWEMVNPGRPVPGMLAPPEPTQYYEPSVRQSGMGPNIEDVTFRRMGVPGIQYDGVPGTLTGLPGNAHPDLLQQQQPHPQSRTPGSLDMQVDPQLLALGQPGLPSSEGESYSDQLGVWQVQSQYLPTTLAGQETERYQEQPCYPPAMQQIIEGREMWNENQMEGGHEFEDWISGPPYEYTNSQQKLL
ncbi:hypothetical protein FQN55_001330 [Onygenales sp. PD_40]|nr:hypothetical protein FQN55_001330 [Onygenales sp. PD_40]KAK2800064.1 hypothetical protein FQN51_006303 [Onygenales sp. PD_10]